MSEPEWIPALRAERKSLQDRLDAVELLLQEYGADQEPEPVSETGKRTRYVWSSKPQELAKLVELAAKGVSFEKIAEEIGSFSPDKPSPEQCRRQWQHIVRQRRAREAQGGDQ